MIMGGHWELRVDIKKGDLEDRVVFDFPLIRSAEPYEYIRVKTPAGSVLGVRELAHDHGNEQPFTRSLPGVEIPSGIVEVILEGGGIPVWAHPPADMVEGLLPTMVAAGLRGLEVYRPRNKRSEVLRLESISKSAGLFTTGGSDWHTPDYGSSLGDFHVTGEEVEGLLRAGGM